MSDERARLPAPPVWRRRMVAHDIDEEHRASTPLELFFDLCFVVGVAEAGNGLHHAVVEGDVGHGLVSYLTVFFAVWWAWMNFTWFASAYDTDDVLYRLATFVQITGVLVLAAGLPRAFDSGDFRVVTLGYLVMRVALVAQWVRAAHDDPATGATARRYATGVSICMVGWGLLLLVPAPWRLPGFAVMAAAELAMPMWAERPRMTPWHPEHIAERFGLFTLIVLGEQVLAATLAIQSAVDGHGLRSVSGVVAGAPLVVFSMWWLYFAKPASVLLQSNRSAWAWGYGHYAVFASAAAVGAGISATVDELDGTAHASATAVAASVTVPVAAYVVVLWLLHLRPHVRDRRHDAVFVAMALLVLAATWAPQPVLVTGLVMAAGVTVSLLQAARRAARDAPRGAPAAGRPARR